MGSTLVARRAGNIVAARATASSRHVTAPSVTGSVGITSNNRLRITRVDATAAASPTATPSPPSSNPSRSTRRDTSLESRRIRKLAIEVLRHQLPDRRRLVRSVLIADSAPRAIVGVRAFRQPRFPPGWQSHASLAPQRRLGVGPPLQVRLDMNR